MARVCMRPGCDRDAAARLTYDTISCQVWLDGVAERQGPSQEICILHAERLTVPRGWMLCDRRRNEPALYVAARSGSPATTIDQVAVAAPSGRPGRRRSAPRSTRVAARTLELFEATEVPTPDPSSPPAPPEPTPTPVIEPAVAAAIPPVDDDLPESLRATSPLLARAFSVTGHQRSVLTQTRDEPVAESPDP